MITSLPIPEPLPPDLHQQTKPVQLLQGLQVLQLCADAEFLNHWEHLYQHCPWATVFQSPAFACTWYRHYHTAYQPILVLATQDEQLTGLLALAQDKRGNLVAAGASQAEYQVWLSSEEHAESFINEALTTLRQAFPHQDIHLEYVPAGTPLAWAQDPNGWGAYCISKTARQPLMRLDQEKIAKELKKKNRREKINRLKRAGNLSFEKITTGHTFRNVLDELAVQSDFRKGAMYNKCVFQEDPNRKTFLQDLFRQGLLHATLLKVDQHIVASNVGVIGNNWLHLQGLNTHSPFFAKHSPGILHFLMLSSMLAEEGMAVFDLTPGANPYKDLLATDYTEATTLTIYSEKRLRKAKLKYKVNTILKQQLPKIGLEKHTIGGYKQQAQMLKEKALILQKTGAAPLLQLARQSIQAPYKYKHYALPLPPAAAASPVELQRDSLADLLRYTPGNSLTCRWEFLMEAMKRFELGQHCYTWTANDRLLGWAWLADAKALQAEGIPGAAILENGVALHSVQVPSSAAAALSDFIRAVAAEAGKDSPSQACLFISQNRQQEKALLQLGASKLRQV
ncbi:GNAT family N-acetyltransferase [Pontibacter mangrovi]|nr:GNAT family N-acetyltransferase [Pontibacter mangrovi]